MQNHQVFGPPVIGLLSVPLGPPGPAGGFTTPVPDAPPPGLAGGSNSIMGLGHLGLHSAIDP